ncbi:MAG: 2-dehydropantoate 2-reductase [Oceanospirillaceae bacterium]
MKVAIYGTGAVGAYFGGRLAESGMDVSFIARGAHLSAIVKYGLKVDSINGDFLIHPAKATAEPADIGIVDLVIVSVKGWQVAQAAAAMKPLIGEHTVVLPLLNGVDAVSILSTQLGAKKVLNGLCGIFAKLTAPGHISHIGAQPWLKFGEQGNVITARAEQLLSILQSCQGFKATLENNITAAVWQKFIFIASTSGVGCVTRANFGEVRASVQTEQFLKAVISEITQVALALKVALPENVETLVWQQILNSSSNSDTSMQRDLLAGRPSELDSQTGAVIRLGQQVGISTPLNEMIYAALAPQEIKARAH